MSYINIVMALTDFVPYISEIIEKKNGFLYIEKKSGKNTIAAAAANAANTSALITSYRENNLNFFITSKPNKKSDFYDDAFCEFVIEGVGGRSTDDTIERIALRLISKTPSKEISAIFNAIKNKLKKDGEIGMGVEGDSAFHKNYFYQKKYAGNKTFLTDVHNYKAPVIKVLSS